MRPGPKRDRQRALQIGDTLDLLARKKERPAELAKPIGRPDRKFIRFIATVAVFDQLPARHHLFLSQDIDAAAAQIAAGSAGHFHLQGDIGPDRHFRRNRLRNRHAHPNRSSLGIANIRGVVGIRTGWRLQDFRLHHAGCCAAWTPAMRPKVAARQMPC